MNWFKNIWMKLTRRYDETEEDYSVEDNEVTYEEKNNYSEEHVAYHYPKGKFRFPIIPDDEFVHQVRKNEVKPTPTPIEQNKRGKPEKVVVPVQMPKRKQRFRPTKLPPAYYGLDLTKETDAPVEFELTSFFKEDKVSDPLLSIEQEKTLSVSEEGSEVDNRMVEKEAQEKELTGELQASERSNELQAREREELAPQEKETTANDEQPSQQKPRKEKRHIPFNVMMLKEDKRKLALRKQAEQEKERINEPQEMLKEVELAKGGASPKQKPPERKEGGTYLFPSLDMLEPPVENMDNSEWMAEQSELLNATLENFRVDASVVNVTKGPSVTRFEIQPARGVGVGKITKLADDIKLSLAARDIRIEAPIPGKHTVGIEVPNKKSRPVLISEVIQSEEFQKNSSPLAVALGLDIAGKSVVTDLRKMPHGLIAGATGSGKSVCINTMLVSLLYKARPEEVKLLLIDPKMVELAPYNRIPHLISPVITDVKAATAALKWAVDEMERRYQLFAHEGVRDITRFNEDAEEEGRLADKMPYIVIIIDELADLMMMSPAEVEESICRIAQKARACGIHMIIATQRPSVDVITGLIKANVPTRIAFSVSSQVDSRTIIDIGGAERLLGRGDMLFLESGSSKPVRLQGTFVSDDDIDRVVAHARKQGAPNYLFEQDQLLKQAEVSEQDELFYEACEFIVEQGNASTSSLQRRFRIGYNRAARMIDTLEEHGYISEARGSRPREVLITTADLETMK